MARMLPDGRRLGAHLALGAGMVKAADRAAEIGATALQIFSDNPTAWRRRPAPSPEIPAFRERLVAAGSARSWPAPQAWAVSRQKVTRHSGIPAAPRASAMAVSSSTSTPSRSASRSCTSGATATSG